MSAARWIWLSYVKTTLVPLLLVEVVIIAAYIATTMLSHRANLASITEQARFEVAGIARREALNIEEKLGAVASLAEVLRTEARASLDTPYVPPPEVIASYRMSPEGMYYSASDTGGSALYYSGVVPVGQAERAKAHRLVQLDRTLQAIREAHPMVVQGYFNTHDSMNRIYPYFDVLPQFPPKMDIPSYNFYYEADAKHNPQRSVVWTDAYLDPAGAGWIVSAIAPVYRADFLEGVVGIDVTIETIIQRVLSLDIPWEGYGVLVSAQGTVIALPKRGEAEWGLAELTKHDYQTAIRQDTLKPDDFNLFKRAALAAVGREVQRGESGVAEIAFGGPKLVAWATVPAPGWKLVVIVPRANVYSVADRLRARADTVAWTMVGGMVLFYAIFFAVLYRRAESDSRKLTRPLLEIDRMVRAIGSGAYEHPAVDMPIREMHESSERIREMGHHLGETVHRLEAAERRAVRNEERLAIVVAASREGVWDWDLATGRVNRSDRYREIIGTAPGEDEPVDGALARLVHPADRDRTLASLSKHLADGTVFDEEFRLLRHDGLYVWVRSIGQSILGPDGKPQRMVGAIADITERRAAAEALRIAKEHAEEGSRAKSDFLANVSHEIRTPLNGVLGMTELLARTPLTPEQRDQVATVRASGEHLLEVINDILDFSRLDAGRVELSAEPFDLRRSLGDILRLMAPAAEAKGLPLRVDVAADVPATVAGDALRLRQVLVNLVGNAIKFTERGDVRVEVSVSPASADAGALTFAVIDTGIGIPEDRCEAIFEAFSQADNSITRRYGGTGLGLTISSRLVQAMGGRLQVASRPGEGSRFSFTVTLPVAAAPTAEGAGPLPASGAEARSLRVLVAEDNPVNRRVVDAVLRKLGHVPTLTEDGTRALEQFTPGAFDVGVFDIQMPGLDGLALTRHIREIERMGGAPRMPILALTANAMASDRAACLEAGMDAYLPKPFTLDDLQGALDALMAATGPAAV
jgi:PAS domain S-box-containing protein